MDVYGVLDKKLFLEALLRLDGPLIKKSAESIKRQREQLKAQQK